MSKSGPTIRQLFIHVHVRPLNLNVFPSKKKKSTKMVLQISRIIGSSAISWKYFASLIYKPGVRQPHAWFLKIVSVQMSVCMHACLCVCPPLRQLITSGVMWHDMDPTQLVKQVLQL